ncbi:MAG: ATP synthase F1 subunit delta [Planctomycetaceae bacterium]|jgi:F-type H+-transporting ATPase subunit delta|nr:ATP synthase F1 subunit delta [Planctomycetaceae bacterium]
MSSAPVEQDARFAEEFNPDVSVESIAAVYASALLGAAYETGAKLPELMEEFQSFFDDLISAQPHFETLLCSALIRADDKVAMLDRSLASSASPLFLNFLKVLARHNRLDILRAIHHQTRVAYNKQIGRVPVTVTTATELDAVTKETLIRQLTHLLNAEPMLHSVVDAETIGGMIVRVGDTIYDGSILTQLKNVRQQMIDRSAHEIQSRRDSFRNTEGN